MNGFHTDGAQNSLLPEKRSAYVEEAVVTSGGTRLFVVATENLMIADCQKEPTTDSVDLHVHLTWP